MNPVLILTHNNLALTKRAVASVKAQDIPTVLLIVDNGSIDGTPDYFGTRETNIRLESNYGVSRGWNVGLDFLFNVQVMGGDAYEHVLVIGNDTVLPPWFYRTLLMYQQPFVTGIAVDTMDAIIELPAAQPLQPCPDFSAFVIHRECWETIGEFDQRMIHYCSDCDYHIRGHRRDVGMYKANVPFYHERSSTLRLAPPEERQEIEKQANKDREVFKSLYGCLPGSNEYEGLFK
jgi:GT2 family glycosyltransferase